MKYHGCILEFTDKRNDELMEAFRRVLRNSSFIDIRKVSEEVANMGCSRFWVSEERAMVVINALIKGKNVTDCMSNSKREMFLEIYRRVLSLIDKNDGRSLFEIVIDVVNSPAPKFYMTPRSAMETIYKIKRGFYDKI